MFISSKENSCLHDAVFVIPDLRFSVIPDFKQVRFSVILDFGQAGIHMTVLASQKLGTRISRIVAKHNHSLSRSAHSSNCRSMTQ